jgi:hypothetical protein
VDIAGITVEPGEPWMKQIARNVTMEGCGALRDCRYLLHDRDTKYTRSFQAIIASGRVESLALPARSPNLNPFVERLIGSIRRECLDHIIIFNESHLRSILTGYFQYHHWTRTHLSRRIQPASAGNIIAFPEVGGLHHRYERRAARPTHPLRREGSPHILRPLCPQYR